MCINKLSTVLAGLLISGFNFSNIGIAATLDSTYDKYFVPTNRIFLPFKVRIAGTTVDVYLNTVKSTTSESYEIEFSSNPTSYVATLAIEPERFDSERQIISWIDAASSVRLNTWISIDEDGNFKLDASSSGGDFGQNYVTATRSKQPQRLTALDGNQIEVLSIKIQINDLPWATYYFGYGVGVVALESFNTSLEVQSFTPVSLPQPKVEGTVVEYVNTIDFPNEPGGHYFYTAAPGEQAKVDAGSAGHFVRTGLEFASGGFVPICRFYGSMSPGPNSHFFTGSEAECQWLQSLQATPIPTDTQQWNYEGIAFYSVVPVRDAEGQKQCMTGTAPVYRAYNNAYPKEGGKNPWDSNHRYSTDRSVMDGMVAQGWRDEGIVLCAPLN